VVTESLIINLDLLVFFSIFILKRISPAFEFIDKRKISEKTSDLKIPFISPPSIT